MNLVRRATYLILQQKLQKCTYIFIVSFAFLRLNQSKTLYANISACFLLFINLSQEYGTKHLSVVTGDKNFNNKVVFTESWSP